MKDLISRGQKKWKIETVCGKHGIACITLVLRIGLVARYVISGRARSQWQRRIVVLQETEQNYFLKGNNPNGLSAK